MWKQHTKSPEYRLIIKMSYLYRNFNYTDKAVWRPSYLNNGNPHSWKGGFMLRRGPKHLTFYSLLVRETMPTNLKHLHLTFWRRYVSKLRMYRNVPTRLTHFCSHLYYRYWIIPKYSERGFLGSYIGNSVHPTEGAQAFVAFLSTMTSVVVTHIYWITFHRKVLVCILNLKYSRYHLGSYRFARKFVTDGCASGKFGDLSTRRKLAIGHLNFVVQRHYNSVNSSISYL